MVAYNEKNILHFVTRGSYESVLFFLFYKFVSINLFMSPIYTRLKLKAIQHYTLDDYQIRVLFITFHWLKFITIQAQQYSGIPLWHSAEWTLIFPCEIMLASLYTFSRTTIFKLGYNTYNFSKIFSLLCTEGALLALYLNLSINT